MRLISWWGAGAYEMKEDESRKEDGLRRVFFIRALLCDDVNHYIIFESRSQEAKGLPFSYAYYEIVLKTLHTFCHIILEKPL